MIDKITEYQYLLWESVDKNFVLQAWSSEKAISACRDIPASQFQS